MWLISIGCPNNTKRGTRYLRAGEAEWFNTKHTYCSANSQSSGSAPDRSKTRLVSLFTVCHLLSAGFWCCGDLGISSETWGVPEARPTAPWVCASREGTIGTKFATGSIRCSELPWCCIFSSCGSCYTYKLGTYIDYVDFFFRYTIEELVEELMFVSCHFKVHSKKLALEVVTINSHYTVTFLLLLSVMRWLLSLLGRLLEAWRIWSSVALRDEHFLRATGQSMVNFYCLGIQDAGALSPDIDSSARGRKGSMLASKGLDE